MKPWVQTLMNVCVNACNVYIYIDVSCINMIYEICRMVINIFKIFFNPKNDIINIKSQHTFMSWHAMKHLESMTSFFKRLKKF